MSTPLSLRRAVPNDAEDIVALMGVIAAERTHSAIDVVWSVADQRRYLGQLTPREAIHVAVDVDQRIVGVQILDRWTATLNSMAHVGQLGTFILPEWRRRGVGALLWEATAAFARAAEYRKLLIYVRASNHVAQRFYRRLGFVPCGRLVRQVIVDGVEDDEVVMERFL